MRVLSDADAHKGENNLVDAAWGIRYAHEYLDLHLEPVTPQFPKVYNLDQRIGGDPDLTEDGRRYSKALARFMKQMHPPTPAQLHLNDDLETPSPMVTDDNFGTDRKAPLSIWTSALKRTVDSAEYFEEEFYEVKKIKYGVLSGFCSRYMDAQVSDS